MCSAESFPPLPNEIQPFLPEVSSVGATTTTLAMRERLESVPDLIIACTGSKSTTINAAQLGCHNGRAQQPVAVALEESR